MTPENGAAPENTGTDQPRICFDDFCLDSRLRTLHRGSEKVKLTPKPFATLEFLVKNRQRVVSKTELLTTIWGGQREISTVEHAVGQLRRALGDTAETGRFIETVPGQGYRFVAEIRSETAPISATAELPKTAHPSSFRHPWRWAVALICIAVTAAAIARLIPPAHIARAMWNGNTLVAMSDSGSALWTYSFELPLRDLPSAESWRTQIVDLDGDGVPEVLVAASFGSQPTGRREEIYCFSSRGKVLWRYKPKADDMEFNTRDLNGPWAIGRMIVVPEGRSNSLWVAVVHEAWWPTFVVRLSSAGSATRMFTSAGNIVALQRFQTPSGSYILAGGINNEYREASLAILSENGPPTTSPQTPGSEYQCIRGCTALNPYRYILLPRSELNAASTEPYNSVVEFLSRNDGVSVETHELEIGSTGFYDFSKDLKPERVAYSGNYRELHQRFEHEGRVKHSYQNCPERKSPAILTIFDERGNRSAVSVPRVTTPD